MNAILHFLRLQTAPETRDATLVRLVPRSDVQWGGPVFRAPTLLTPKQIRNELPFSVNFSSKLRRSR